jgi:sigma-B regulation protein RsbU (phosphoserine phosphatase)
MPITELTIDLVSTICVILVCIYALSRTRYFRQILDRQFNITNQLVFILVFGALAVFGTYSGTKLPSGPIINIRDVSAMIAGLLGGPCVGLGAGLIGGVHRYFLGGMSAVPCSLTTVIAGTAAGLIYMWQKGKFISIWTAAVFAIIIELLHSGIALFTINPYDVALTAVKSVTLPVVLVNAIGIIIAALMVRHLIQERKNNPGGKA